MSYDLYLSYTGRKSYLTCPKQYWYRYIQKDKTPVDIKKTMFGSTIGKIFEWFYEKRLWSNPDPIRSSVDLINEASELVFSQEGYRKGSDYSWESDFFSELKQYVPLGVEIIKKHGLLTINSQSELDLTVSYSPSDSNITIKLGGRADFVHYNKPDDVWILDGKAYKQRDKYVDSDQLIWYATQHYLKYRVAPNKIGFVYWYFPDSPLSYVAYNSDSMRQILKSTVEISKKILDKDFLASPTGECHRCAYKSKCDDGIKYIASRRVMSGGRIEDSIFDLEDVTSSGG